MTDIIKQPFTNLQLELLKLYSLNLSDEELLKVRDMLAQLFADRATAHADRAWDEKGLDAKVLLNKHRRTAYQPKTA